MRHDLYQQVLRFPLPQFKTMSAGEIIPMIVAETEPVGGFIGEAVVTPIFQGGLLVTYMVFIFNQDLWLGLAAIALYPPQIYLIPRLQRKINLLSKDRVQTARAAVRSHRRIGRGLRGDPRQRHAAARARRHQPPAGQDLRDPLRHLQAQVLRQVPEQLPGADHAVLLLFGRRLPGDQGQPFARRACRRARGVQGHPEPVEGAARRGTRRRRTCGSSTSRSCRSSSRPA